MRTLIISGGNIEDDFALPLLEEKYDYLIAVDKGLEFLKRAGRKPDQILGDFDSADSKVKEYFDTFNIPTKTFCPVKDSTDIEIAIQEAITLGSREIVIIGGTGSRLDHVLGTIKNLSLALEKGVSAIILDAKNRIRMLDHGITILRDEQYGKYVSVHAIGGDVEGLNLKGFFYSLKDYHLDAFSALGISNEIVEEKAEISFEKGRLLLIESKD